MSLLPKSIIDGFVDREIRFAEIINKIKQRRITLMKHSPVVEKTILFANEKPLMDFYAALKAIADGQKVTKLEWANPDTFGVLEKGVLMIHRDRVPSDDLSGKSLGYNYYTWIISEADLSGTDWVIVP